MVNDSYSGWGSAGTTININTPLENNYQVGQTYHQSDITSDCGLETDWERKMFLVFWKNVSIMILQWKTQIFIVTWK